MSDETAKNDGKSLSDLSDILFDQLERLNDPDLSGEAMEAEIKRSKAVSDVAGQVISNANTAIRGWELRQAMTNGAADASMPKMLEA